MATRLIAFLHEGGYLLASPYWNDDQLPAEIVELRRNAFGITSPLPTRDGALAPFRGLRILHEEYHRPAQESTADIDAYCQVTIDRVCRQAQITSVPVREAMIDRLRGIKMSTNELRPYLRYTTLVAAYSSADYPHRYVELF